MGLTQRNRQNNLICVDANTELISADGAGGMNMQLHQVFKVKGDQIVANIADAVYYMGCVEGVMYRLNEEDRLQYQYPINGALVTAFYIVPLETKTTDFSDCVCHLYDENRQKIDLLPQTVFLGDLSDVDDEKYPDLR